MATWPTGIPDYVLQNGYTESPPNNIIRTQMDKGPAKIRRRTTANVRPISAMMELTAEQVEIFDSFFVDDCKDGSLRFEWNHPRTGAPVEFRFVGQPEYTPIGGDTWIVRFNLEIMP